MVHIMVVWCVGGADYILCTSTGIRDTRARGCRGRRLFCRKEKSSMTYLIIYRTYIFFSEDLLEVCILPLEKGSLNECSTQ
jgi:hypothetical protein